jgi:protein with PEP-CTERM/exosortase system signal
MALLTLVCGLLLCWSNSANALLFSTAPGAMAASADFEILAGGFLQVTLTNTGTGNPANPADILTALFFNLAGDPSLSRDSAVLGAGSTVIHGPAVSTDPAPNGVGGEWAYNNTQSVNGANEGISSAGFGTFGVGDRFPGKNLQGPDSVNGVQYGITTAFDTPVGDNMGISTVGLIKNQVVFTLDNFTGSLADISHVSFQYGTMLSDTNIPGTPPVPDSGPTAMLLGLSLSGLGFVRRFVKR